MYLHISIIVLNICLCGFDPISFVIISFVLNTSPIRFPLGGEQVALDQIVALESVIGIPLVTPELQACAFLYEHGPTPSHHLQGALRTSPAGFHNVKRRLVERGIIVGTKSRSDARVTLYDLTDHVRQILDTRTPFNAVAPRRENGPQIKSLAEAP